MRLLFRLAAAFVAVLPIRAAAQSVDPACHPEIDPARPQYIVGYGSLMQEASKRRTTPDAGPNRPVEVTGYQRAWNVKGATIGFSTTYLGVVKAEGARMAAAIYRDAKPGDIQATDAREAYYCRDAVPPEAIRLLDDTPAPTNAQYWIYSNRPEDVAPPTAAFPIVQSYVDIFIGGCIELQTKVDVPAYSFADVCVTTTEGWAAPWVNDRLQPRRPFIHEPLSGQIDALLHRLVPDAFAAIRLE